jgi:hypothetical protein
MKTRVLALLILALVGWHGNAFAQQDGACNRECLKNALMRYMRAVAVNDPASAGIIVGFRQTENAEVKRLGTGAWQSVTALGSVYRQFMDPVTGQAAYFGIVDESGKPAVATVRVAVVRGQVTEAEWYIGREGQPGRLGAPAADGSGANLYDPANLIASPPPAGRHIPVNRRLSRESLLGITNSYFDGITSHDGSIVMAHPGCLRVENGRQTTGRPLPAGSTDGYQGKTDCTSGFAATGSFHISLVAGRRYPLVDEEQQVVMGTVVFIRFPDAADRRNGLSEFFFIDNERIREIHAAMFYPAPDTPMPNWPPYDGNFPLPPDFGRAR